MAVTVTEGWHSRTTQRGSNDSIETLWTVHGTNDDATAEAAFLAAVPSAYRGLNRSSTRIEWMAMLTWRGVATFSPQSLQQKDPVDLGTSEGEVSYTTGSATAKRITSLETVSKYARQTNPWFETEPPDFKGLIGVNKDGVEGVDVGVPAPSFRETHVLNPASVTNAYMRTVARMAYTVNGAPFKGYAAGEVLFTGAEFNQRDSERVTAVYTFEIQENESALTVGEMTEIVKQGHDYLWVLYGDEEDSVAEFITKQPTAAYVERVYKRTNFAALMIGT